MAKLKKRQPASAATPQQEPDSTRRKQSFFFAIRRKDSNANDLTREATATPSEPDLPFLSRYRSESANTRSADTYQTFSSNEPQDEDFADRVFDPISTPVNMHAARSAPKRTIDLRLPEAPTNTNDHSSTSTYASISRVPVEIWKMITSFLNAADAANLALSSRLFRLRLGAGPWQVLKTQENKDHRITFLLPMDQALSNQLFCFLCASYHIRSAPENEAMFPMYKEHLVYQCPNRNDVLLPKMRLAHNRTLPFYLVQLAMRAHRFGPTYGISLPALSRSWTCRESDWSHRTRFHIHAGHLLVRITSTCFVKANLTPSEVRLLLFARNDYNPYFSACYHWQDGDLIRFTKCALTHIPEPPQSFTQQLRDRPRIPSQQLRKPNFMPKQCEDCKPLRRCPQCPTEYLFEIKLLEDKKDPVQPFKHAISITRWSDLGDGVSPASPEWASCNGPGEYNSFAAVKNATICSLFEAAVSRGAPTQRAMSLGHNKWTSDDVY